MEFLYGNELPFHIFYSFEKKKENQENYIF